MQPQGFIRAAMAPGANPVLITRYENGAVGTLAGHRFRKLNIISFNYGKYRLNGTIAIGTGSRTPEGISICSAA